MGNRRRTPQIKEYEYKIKKGEVEDLNRQSRDLIDYLYRAGRCIDGTQVSNHLTTETCDPELINTYHYQGCTVKHRTLQDREYMWHNDHPERTNMLFFSVMGNGNLDEVVEELETRFSFLQRFRKEKEDERPKTYTDKWQ